MRKYTKIIIFALCLVLCLAAFVSCKPKNDDAGSTVSVTLPEQYPAGIESFSAGTGNPIVLPKGSACAINVTLAQGYAIGSFKLFVGSEEIKPSNGFSDGGKVTLNYSFTVNSDVTVTFTGAPETHKLEVKSVFSANGSGFELVTPYEYDFRTVTADGAETKAEIDSLQNVKNFFNQCAESGFLYGSTITIVAKIKGDEVAFPHFVETVSGEADLEYRTSYSVEEKESKTEAIITIRNDTTVTFNEERLEKQSAIAIRQVWERESWIRGEIINENGTALNSLADLYKAQEIYVSLDKKGYDILTCDVLADAFKNGYNELNVNGKDVKAETKTIDGNLYLKLAKPDSYNANKAEGYYFDDEKLVNFLKNSEKFTDSNVTFKSAVMDWGNDQTYQGGATYCGYRTVNGKTIFALCLAADRTSITVVINGKTEITFENVQTENELTQGIATLHRYYEGNENFNGIRIINGKEETHQLVLDAKEYGEITSVEVK